MQWFKSCTSEPCVRSLCCILSCCAPFSERATCEGWERCLRRMLTRVHADPGVVFFVQMWAIPDFNRFLWCPVGVHSCRALACTQGHVQCLPVSAVVCYAVLGMAVRGRQRLHICMLCVRVFSKGVCIIMQCASLLYCVLVQYEPCGRCSCGGGRCDTEHVCDGAVCPLLRAMCLLCRRRYSLLFCVVCLSLSER